MSALAEEDALPSALILEVIPRAARQKDYGDFLTAAKAP
jgi:hypothetical protein